MRRRKHQIVKPGIPTPLQELMERFDIPGVSIAVIKDNQIDWAKGYGQADVTTKSLVTPETNFRPRRSASPSRRSP